MRNILILSFSLLMCFHVKADTRTWTVLGETSGEFKQKAVDRSGNRPDLPVKVSFKVPGPGVLRVTCWENPHYSGIAQETGVMDMTRTGDSSMLAYGLFSMTDPKVPQSGAPLMSCTAGRVMRAQDAFVEFRAPVNYSFNTQLGCGVRLKVEFSPGVAQPGENFAPTGVSATSGSTSSTVKSTVIKKKSSYRVGAIENGQKIGAAQVPWVFNTDGTFEATGMWKGTWSQQADGSVKATMKYNNVTDELVIRFDDKGFTAYKGGKPYRWGTLIP